MVAVGTNFLAPISDVVPYQGLCCLIGLIYFLGIYRRQFFKLIHIRLYQVWLIGLLMPLILMIVSERDFLRADYTNLIVVLFVFVTSSLIGTVGKNVNVIITSALTIGLISVSLNIYEFIVENNVWSTAPGRSAGFFINPNRASQAIIIFSLVYLAWKNRKFYFFDFFFILMVLFGTIVTFSRSGIMILLLTIALFYIWKYNVNWKTITGMLLILSLLITFQNVLLNSYLEDDVRYRLISLLEGGVQSDFEEERGSIALESYYIALESPITGVGVGSTKKMDVGAHNTFISIFLDYGILGLIFYLFTIIGVVVGIYKNDNEQMFFAKLFLAWFLLFNFFTHNMLEDTVMILAFGLAVSKILFFRVNSVLA